MKLFTMITLLFLSALTVEAHEEINGRITALFIISSDSRDYVGQGREKIYCPEDGTFTFSQISYYGAMRIDFRVSEKREWWQKEASF